MWKCAFVLGLGGGRRIWISTEGSSGRCNGSCGGSFNGICNGFNNITFFTTRLPGCRGINPGLLGLCILPSRAYNDAATILKANLAYGE